MACYTQEEIAEACECSETYVRDEISAQMAEFPNARKSDLAHVEYAIEFDPLIYNVWKQQKENGTERFIFLAPLAWLAAAGTA
jgi:hypothetical protein